MEPEQTRTAVLVGAILLLVLVAIVVFALYGGRKTGGSTTPRPNPCKSQKMPVLAPGVSCQPASGGVFAWLTTATPTESGVRPPSTLKLIKTVTASGSNKGCITESACQGVCLDDPACVMYAYDSSRQAPTARCPAAGSVCTTYAGALPDKIGLNPTPYVSGGIPGKDLPVKIE